MKVSVIVVAAGTGSRFGYERNKLFYPLCGEPVLAHTLRHIFAARSVSEVVIVHSRVDEKEIRRLVDDLHPIQPVRYALGGAEREDSVYNGLMADRYAYPVIIGHEGAGVVVEVGEGVTSVKVGDRVTAETTLTACGTCEYCRKGETNMCAHRKGLGSAADGYFANYCVASAQYCHKLADDLSFEEGALAEPFACVVHAVSNLTHPYPGDLVLVVGPGPMGQMVAALAKACGCVVVMSGITGDEERLRFARENYGIQHTVNSQETDLKAYLEELSEGRGADFVYECTGTLPGIDCALDCCKRKGTFVAIGMNMGKVPIDYYNVIYKKEITIQGDKSTSTVTWARTLRILNGKCVDLKPLITDVIPMSQWLSGYEKFRKGKAMKVVMHPWDD